MKKGLFVTLEGIEGAGKTTAADFITKYLAKANIDYILTREPGGTEIAEKIRQVLLNHHQEKMHPDTEMLLYFASRAQHLHRVIIPALEEEKWVICDRFTDATYAYQGGGRGLSQEKISVLEGWVQGDLRPDYTLLLDVTAKKGFGRIKKDRELDRLEIEQEQFYENVRTCYLDRVQKEPGRFRIVDADKSIEEVYKQIENILQQIISD